MPATMPDPDHFAHARTIQDITHLKEGDDSGYVEGRVFMIWPPRNAMHRIMFEVHEGVTRHRFIVEIPCRDRIFLHVQDRIQLSLRGVRVDASNASLTALRYPHCVVFKYAAGIDAGKVIDMRDGKSCLDHASCLMIL